MYKIDKLLKANRRLFHTADLALLWGVTNRNTLYTAIKRYVGSGILYPVFKGLYSTIPVSKLDPFELGSFVVHSFSYVSTETILYEAGLISQRVYPMTFVSSYSKKVCIAGNSYTFRKASDVYLFNQAGIYEKNGVFFATPERAVADMLYFNPHFHFDGKIDFNKVKAIQKEVYDRR